MQSRAAWHASLAVLALALTMGPHAHAGPFEDELGSDPVKLAEKVKLSLMNGDGDGADTGRGPVPYLKALGAPPKRVALISFYLYDSGNKKEKSYNFYNAEYTMRMNNTRRYNVDAEAIEQLSTELHDAGIGPLKQAFAAAGMQLLTPDEFLDSEEKKAAYANVNIEAGGMDKLFGALQSKSATQWQWGAAYDYRLIKLTTVGDDRGNNFALATTGAGVGKLAAQAGHDLAKALGVDAVAILYNVVQADAKSIRLRGTYLYVFGPNPVKDSGQSLYWTGHQYSGGFLRTDVDFIQTSKDELVSADYAGYGVVAGAVGTRVAQHIKSKIN